MTNPNCQQLQQNTENSNQHTINIGIYCQLYILQMVLI